MPQHPRIIDVTRKPSKCPVCGERPVDIIYGTGDMSEVEFLFQYRRQGIMGGDNIPRNPPVWVCPCGCKRFRKVNPDGTYAPVKVKLLKNIRKAPLTKITWEAESVTGGVESARAARYWRVDFETETGEADSLCVCAPDEVEARRTAEDIVASGSIGLKGTRARVIKITEEYAEACRKDSQD